MSGIGYIIGWRRLENRTLEIQTDFGLLLTFVI